MRAIPSCLGQLKASSVVGGKIADKTAQEHANA